MSEKFSEFEKLRADLEAEKLRQETVSLKRATDEKQSQPKSEWKFFIDQIYWERADFNWDTCSEVDDVKNMISTFESRLEMFSKICGELEGAYGEEASSLGFIEDSNKVINSI